MDLFECLKELKKLRYLDLSHNGFGEETKEGDLTHQPIQMLIMGSSTLEHVNVKGNKVSVEEAQNYKDALHMSSSVTRLDIVVDRFTPKEVTKGIKDELGYNKLIK